VTRRKIFEIANAMPAPQEGRIHIEATDKISVTRLRCKNRFRERIGRLREGYQGQCPNCGCLINFTTESMDPTIQRAMTEARRIRNGFIPEPVKE
jgi:hypothetical protein